MHARTEVVTALHQKDLTRQSIPRTIGSVASNGPFICQCRRPDTTEVPPCAGGFWRSTKRR